MAKKIIKEREGKDVEVDLLGKFDDNTLLELNNIQKECLKLLNEIKIVTKKIDEFQRLDSIKEVKKFQIKKEKLLKKKGKKEDKAIKKYKKALKKV